MPRRSSALPLVLGALALILVIAIVLASIPRLPLPTGLVPNLGLRMTEEVNPPQVLYAAAIQLDQGTVWQVSYDVNGIRVEQRSSELIERVNLSDVDLGVNDVVAPILWDWYFDGVDDCVEFDINDEDAAWNTPYTMYIYAKVFQRGSDQRIAGLVNAFGIQVDSQEHNGYARLVLTNTSGGKNWYPVARIYDNIDCRYHLLGNLFNGTHLEAWLDGSKSSSIDVTIYGSDEMVQRRQKIEIGRWGALYSKSQVSFALIDFNEYKSFSNVMDGYEFFASATFYNGTHYLDLIHGLVGTPQGNPARIPTENPTLFLVKSLASDNKLHLKYVPPNSIFRIKYNGMVYEWRVTGEPNAAGLIEDYAIDIASIFGSTVLPNAAIELIYDSQKVRFYVPSGFQVVVEGNGWSETHEVPLNSSYVDFGLPSSGTYTIKILGYEEEPRIRVETSGDLVRVTVTDEAGYALAGAKVYVYDASGNLAAVGV
ncbi:MAG: hypothetical protein DRO14_05640, partial [Thermoprotei archaeon]